MQRLSAGAVGDSGNHSSNIAKGIGVNIGGWVGTAGAADVL